MSKYKVPKRIGIRFLNSLLIELKFCKIYKDINISVTTYEFETYENDKYYINYFKSSKNYSINVITKYGILINEKEYDDYLDSNQVIKFLKTKNDFISYFRKNKINKIITNE